jgi:hypothetical protein
MPSRPLQLPHLSVLSLNELNMSSAELIEALQALTATLQSLILGSISLHNGTWASVFSTVVSTPNLKYISLKDLRCGHDGPWVNFVNVARERPFCFTADMKQDVLDQLQDVNGDTAQFLAMYDSFSPELDDEFALVVPTLHRPVFDLNLD